MKKYILSIDQGTTSTRSCLIDTENMQMIGFESKEYPQIYPKPSWVEHDLNEIWSTVEITTAKVLKKYNISGSSIVAIGITNQRETTCAFDRNGIPLSNAIVWQDRRTHDFCETLKNLNLENNIKEKTGLPIDPYFSASKMNWLLKNNTNVEKASLENNLLFGTIDTFLLYKLSGNSTFKTDASNASRTQLMNLKNCQWDQELLKIFEIDNKFLPEICDSFAEFGKTRGLNFLPDGIKICGILGDQQAALFGQAGVNKGDMKCTYGTGAFLLLNTGKDLIYSTHGLLTTVAFKINNKPVYALEGSSYIAGAAVQWLRDNLQIIKKSSEIEALAKEIVNYDELKNILFFPFFTGVGSPHWKSETKAAILGLTRDSGKSHIAFAALEGVALSIHDLISAMKKDLNENILSLKVDGGASANCLLMELQSTISELKIQRPKVIETTAYGAAYAAAVGAQIIDLNSLSKYWEIDREFAPEEKYKFYLKNKKELWNKTLSKYLLF